VGNLEGLNKVLSDNHGLFSRIAIHPSTNFPGRQHEGVVGTLLRKKLEPELEDWVQNGRVAALEAGIDRSKLGDVRIDVGDDYDDDYNPRPEPVMEESVEGLTELWSYAAKAYSDRFSYYLEHEEDSNFTLAEHAMGIGKIRTGLSRNLAADEDDYDEDEQGGAGKDVNMTDAAVPGQPQQQQPPQPQQLQMEPEYALCFGARGDMSLPASVQLDLQQRLKERKEAARLAGLAQ